MSGVAGASRVLSRNDLKQFVKSYKTIISKFPGFKSVEISGSYNSNLSKTSFGDIDLIVHIESNKPKQQVKVDLVKFLEQLPHTVVVPFASPKYTGKRTYNSGEIVSIRYHDDKLGYSVQVDNIIALDKQEATFKRSFLDLPAEKQGLVLGLVKVSLLEEPKEQVFKRLHINVPLDLEENQEYEFNLSSIELQLRKVTYIPGTLTQQDREVVWRSNKYSDVVKLLHNFNLNSTFEQLLDKAQKSLTNPRSKKRVQGVFASMITVKSGEVGTEKGFAKIQALNNIQKALNESYTGSSSMIKFKSYIDHLIEASVRSSDFPRVAGLVSSYLTKHVGKTYYLPQQEVFISGGRAGIGVRFFVGGQSIRLNWVKTINQSVGLTSVDYWDGSKINQTRPTNRIEFNSDHSLVMILPFIRDFLQGKIKTAGVYVNEDVQLNPEDVITEAVYSNEQLLKTVNNMLNGLRMGVQIRQQSLMGGNKKFGPKWNDAQRIVRELYSDLFKARPGNKQLIIDKEDVDKIDPKKIVSAIVQGNDTIEFSIVPGKAETIEVEGATSADMDRMSYEEQLDSLKTGMKLLMSNATNALFVGGRGGTGKTQTVEDMLHDAGRQDGEGYFKITGSATPVGIYRILYEHRKDVILFDDSDSALNDQEGRNLFKAASDTKRIRKISWMKGGKNFVDPDNYDEESDDDTLPRYFEFTGKIIFISNLPLSKLDPDGALRTRGYVINVDPTNEEIYDFMLKIVDKIPLDVNYPLDTQARREVVDVLRSRKVADKTANLRSLVRGLNTRAGVEQQGGTEEEWKKFVKMFA